MTQLTGIAGEIEEAIGLEAAVALLRARGGTKIEIPRRAEGSALAELIGVDAVHQLGQVFGHGRLALPLAGLRGRAARDAEVRAEAMRLLGEGVSQREVALRCDIDLRTVERYAARLADDRQGDLGL